MNERLKRVVRLFYGFQFFFGLLLWVPVFYEFQKRVGLSETEIFSIQSIYYLAFCLLEIPTGLIADLWGRRLCMRLGSVLVMAANLLPIFAPSYAGFIAHFLLVALSRSLISGASSAYMYDFMKVGGAEKAYREIEGKARAYGLFGKIVCWAGVGMLMNWHLTMPYWLTFAANGIGLGFAMMLPALPVQKREGRLDFRAVAGALTASPVLAIIMVQGIAIFVMERIVQVNLFQPILGTKGFDVAAYGWVMSIMAAFEAAGALGYKSRWIRGDSNGILLISLVLAASLAAIPWLGQWGTLAALCVYALGTGLSYPIQRQLMNDAIPDSRYRATLLSVESILDRATCSWAAFVLGSYMATGRLNAFLLHSAALIAALVIGLQILIRSRLGALVRAPQARG